ncbi:dioxygenase [Ferruginivarius sediminum]|uniref:Dioxygenase n=1 Tax=Ferruginivarius sediminum TaxID=2661937 RepID=A0A369T5B3_9PROT|nr:class III extradiol ring-cleavage dioxygenase [Ferruginivarius sediminum]RDD60523.1 dioxygenase [Ferruginivarius sediminum]
MSTHLPSLFISHGPPTMVVDDLAANRRLKEIAEELPRPEAILCISAHWIEQAPNLTAAAEPETIHDYMGFPAELYRLSYPAPGAPGLAQRAAECLRATGIPARLDEVRGRDHGAWQTAMLMYPEADVPLIQLSLGGDLDPRRHYDIGRALAPLSGEGILVMATGTAVHNLRAWRQHRHETPAWARAFDDWLAATIEAGDLDALLDWRDEAPESRMAHPSEEHFTPLFVAAGAGGFGAGNPGRALHRGFEYGSLSMASFAFDAG